MAKMIDWDEGRKRIVIRSSLDQSTSDPTWLSLSLSHWLRRNAKRSWCKMMKFCLLDEKSTSGERFWVFSQRICFAFCVYWFSISIAIQVCFSAVQPGEKYRKRTIKLDQKTREKSNTVAFFVYKGFFSLSLHFLMISLLLSHTHATSRESSFVSIDQTERESMNEWMNTSCQFGSPIVLSPVPTL